MTGFFASLFQRAAMRGKAHEPGEADRFRSVVEHVVDGIVTVDADLRIESWNRAAERIFGYRADEILGRCLTSIVTGWPEDVEAPTGANPPREAEGRRRDGSTFPVELAVGDFRLGGRVYYTAIFRDITERKQADEAMRLAKEAADEANQAKSRFLANMSHEIRTPLGAILGFSELLINPGQSESDRIECMAAIRRNGDLLSNIINDILDLSKVEAGKVQVELQAVRLGEVMTDISSLLGLQAEEKGITLAVRYEGPMPTRIRTDALRLRQILVNIVGNAIKFTNRGQVEVIVKQLNDALRPRLAFVVTDTGCGIPSGIAARLFNPFAQGDSSRTRMSGGTGLGLVLARRLAQLLGGDVVLSHSVPGEGSTFTITVDPGEPSLLLDLPEDKSTTKLPLGGSRLDGVKILLVDDSPDNQLLITKFLYMAGADVDVANNGLQGMEKALTGTYDLVVMDIQMPVMDGYEAVALLRGRGYSRPVIALTAHALKEEQLRCINSGFDGHLSKPIHRQFLIEQLHRYADQRSNRSSSLSAMR